MKRIEIGIAGGKEALAQFARTWKGASRGERLPQATPRLDFSSLAELLSALSAKRLALLDALATQPGLGIRAPGRQARARLQERARRRRPSDGIGADRAARRRHAQGPLRRVGDSRSADGYGPADGRVGSVKRSTSCRAARTTSRPIARSALPGRLCGVQGYSVNLPATIQESGMKSITAAKRLPRKGSHFDVAKRLGLIGCLDGPPDLAQNLKKYVRRAVHAKYRAR